VAVTTWVLILLVITFIIALAVILRDAIPKAARKAQVEHPEKKDTSMEVSEDLSPKLKTNLKPPETPLSYGENEINLMYLDPYTVYTYWEINELSFKRLEKNLGGLFATSVPVLRVFEIDPHNFKEALIQSINITDEDRSWYIHIGKPNIKICVELGRFLTNGEFILICRSNPVETPSDNISNIVDEEWMLVDENQRRLYKRLTDQEQAPSSPGISYSLLQDQH
jgi:uncharacterized protein